MDAMPEAPNAFGNQGFKAMTIFVVDEYTPPAMTL
jgi:hypothetical protein